jgi:exosortase
MPIYSHVVCRGNKNPSQLSNSIFAGGEIKRMTRMMRFRTGLFLACLVAIALAFLASTAAFKNLLTPTSSSQLIFVPLISAYFIWLERGAIFSRPKYSPRGAARIGVATVITLITAFLVFHGHPLLGYFLTAGSAGALIAAAFIGIYGNEALMGAIAPLALLMLMLPIPHSVTDQVISALQVGSTYLSARVFGMLGVPVFRNGFVLSVPGVSIEVAKECSGINSTLALLLTMGVVAFQGLHTFWRRAVLLLVVLPLSIVKNAIRIVTLTLLAVKVDPSFLTGRLHHQGGVVFYLVALALMFPVFSLLRRDELSRGHARTVSEQVRSLAR